MAGVVQESNTFAPFRSMLTDFSIEKQTAIISSNRGANTELGGMFKQLDVLQIEPVPLISAWAVSAGPVEDSAFEFLAGLLIEQIGRIECDGLLIALHGSWLSGSYSSADAELVRRVRATIGSRIPIVVTLDFHANVHPLLLREIQGLVGYHTYPHIDMADTGRKAAQLLHDIVTGDLAPRVYWVSIPLLAPPQSATTDQSPIKDIIARLDQELASEGILSASFFCVQPWLDTEHVASSIVVVAASDNTEVPARMRQIAGQLWDHRGEFTVDWVSPSELVGKVIRNKCRPAIVSEAYDAPTGGAPGDHPGLLSILLPHQEQLSACLYIVDAEAVELARHLETGGKFRGLLGAKRDQRYHSPLLIEGRLRHLSDGVFTFKGPVFTGRQIDMGPTAVLEVGRLKIVVASRAVPVVDPELYRSQRIEPKEQDIVAVKSPTLFRPGYSSMLGRVLHLDMPGVCRGNLSKVAFESIGRPIWPLDHFDWDASSQPVFCFPQGGTC